ncbi:MAG TPA: response regulator [Nitrolancea sp.]|nr:response regulator [Nitrolancea sp.]
MNLPETSPLQEETEEPHPGATTCEPRAADNHAHTVFFYEDDDYLIDKLARYVGDALDTGAAAIVLATEAHLRALEPRLTERGFDLAAIARDDRYQTMMVDTTLERVMRYGAPDSDLFFALFDEVIARAARNQRTVVVYGELVAQLVQDGNSASAVALEHLWNQLAHRRGFELLCAYPIHAFSTIKDAASLAAICDLHTRVTPAESVPRFDDGEEQRRAIARLQQRVLALESELARRDRAGNDRFVSVAAHELKTPISSLRAYAQLLLREGQEQGQIDRVRFEHAMGAIESQTGKLTRLISNVIETLELDDGAMHIDVMTVDLAELVRSTLRREFSDAHHTFEFIAPASCIVRVDPHRMQQAILNLLDNASKYSPPGSVVSVELESLSDGAARLRVTDSGMGIAKGQRAAVFDRFYRAHVNSHQSGLGLGLYVARNIVELHGGTLQIEDAPGRGSRLVLELPAYKSMATFDESLGHGDTCRRVLVVDDDESIRQLIEVVLEDEGFCVDFAAEGYAALEVISRKHPDLILLDMRMPGMDGWEFVDRYRTQYGHRAPIIVFTAAQNAADRGAEVDADAYIAKPFDLDVLIERIKSVLQQSVHKHQ